MSVADWRSPRAYDYLHHSNWPAAAWEFLRRNPEYRADLIARFVLNRCPTRTIIARETAEALAAHEPPVLLSRIGQEASRRFNIPAPWLSAVMRAESHGDANSVSDKGAIGLMQVRNRELDAAGGRIATETGLPRHTFAEGETVAGLYRNRLTPASGRFAMIDDGLGFQLVPWSSSLEKGIGKQVLGVMSPDGGVDWSFGRKRGIGR